MNVVKMAGADVFRDGGSYAFWFYADDGNLYEFFIKTRRFEQNPDSYYHPPVINMKDKDGSKLVKTLSWEEANQFILPLKYKNSRFKELVKIVQSNGGAWWEK